MATHKHFDHALAFCKQAALLSPSTPYAYADALDYALEGKDVEAMEWAAGNLLKQDWPVDSQKLQLKAQDRLATLARPMRTTTRRQPSGWSRRPASSGSGTWWCGWSGRATPTST